MKQVTIIINLTFWFSLFDLRFQYYFQQMKIAMKNKETKQIQIK